jgi:hypothetical protein
VAIPPRSRLSPSPGVGRGGVHRLPEPRPSPSPGVGRGGVRRLPRPRPTPSPRVGRGVVRRLPRPRPSSSPWVGRCGVRRLPEESEPWGRARRSSSSSEAEAESEPWGRARRGSSSSEAETGAEPWGRARRSFLCCPRLDLAAVDLTLANGTAVGAGQVALHSCQVGQWSGEVTAVTSALSTGARVRIRCQAILALNAPSIRSVGVAIWPRLLLCEDWASGEPKVCFVACGGPRARRESSRVGCLCPRLGSGEARSCPLSGLSLDLNRAHQAFAALC